MRIPSMPVARRAAAVLVLVLLTSGAWTGFHRDGFGTSALANSVRASASSTHASPAASTFNYRRLVAYWWNEGSCHGYPDVTRIYAVEFDANDNVVDWKDAGATAGTDSCNQYHDSEYIQSAYDWCQCPDGVDGAVMGDPNGSTTEHP